MQLHALQQLPEPCALSLPPAPSTSTGGLPLGCGLLCQVATLAGPLSVVCRAPHNEATGAVPLTLSLDGGASGVPSAAHYIYYVTPPP
eukprot:2542799-Prymnesium_polylepis.1